MQLKDKTVLVTGASSGIGAAIAETFAQDGAFVIINYRKNKTGAEKTLAAVKKNSDGIIMQTDLSVLEQVAAMYRQFKADGTKIDILVNNAGEAKSGELSDYDNWEFQWRNILMSAVYTTSEFISQADGKGKIISIASIYGVPELGNPDFMQYGAAKAAIISFTKNLAKKYAPGILANAVAPGFVWTPPWEGTSKADMQKCIDNTRLKRFIEPAEIADVVLMLAKNDAVTGEVYKVDGGVGIPEIF
jgi:3-oxoacyl-[acyl-carrier protein] reductase